MLSAASHVPIAQRDTVACFVGEPVGRICDGREVALIIRQSRGPNQPIELGVFGAIVERHSKWLLHRFVERQLLPRHFRRKEFVAQQLIPHQVIFLAPCAGFIERQPIVIAVAGHLRPLRGKIFREAAVFFCLRIFAHCLGQPGIALQADNGFDREIGVVGQVSGEVVRAELIFGIEALLSQICGPAGQLRPIWLREIRIALHLGKRGHQDQHIAALFHRHLAVFIQLPASVYLAVCQRILTQVMRGIGPRPSTGAGIIQHGTQLRFQ